MGLRKQILAMPASERLEHALFLVDELAGNSDANFAFLNRKFGLTKSEARIFCALNAAAPNIVTRGQLFIALACDEDTNEKIVDVFLCKLRAKLPFSITVVWGVGWKLDEPFSIPQIDDHPVIARVKRGEAWSLQDDIDLQTMWGNGSDISIIADELERSERAVLDRIRVKGLRK